MGPALDLGCGNGLLTAALVVGGLATRAVGVDVSRQMTVTARHDAAPGTAFAVADGTAVPFPDASFDLVVGQAFLHHVLDVAACLAEVRRVLRPGGVATFEEPWRDGYAFVEGVLRVAAWSGRRSDRALQDYVDFLAYVRVHAGDVEALARLPLPDKHVFTAGLLELSARRAGFEAVSFAPAVDPYPGCWRDVFGGITVSIAAAPATARRVSWLADRIDRLVGARAIARCCPHVQAYFYAP